MKNDTKKRLTVNQYSENALIPPIQSSSPVDRVI